MKVTKLFLTAAIVLGLGLTACSNDDDIPSSDGGEKGNTNVSVTLKMSRDSGLRTKALPEDYNNIGEWAGKDDIKTVAVYIIDGSSVSSKSLEVGVSGSGKDYEKIVNGSDISLVPKTQNAAIKTTAGIKKVYVLVNGTTEVVNALAKTPVAEFEDAYSQAALYLANSGASIFPIPNTSADKLAVKNGITDETIVMTNVKPETINVEANVTDLETLAATSPKNRVSLEVERAVARVMVSTQALTYTVPAAGGSPLGTISDINWVVAQGESSFFIQRKNDWATPNFSWIPTSDADYWGTDITGASSKYDYSGLFEGYDATTQFGGTAVVTMSDYANNPFGNVTTELNDKLSGKFILPNTHQPGAGTTSSYKKGNTAYVLIRAKFTPAAAAFADGEAYTPNTDFFVGENGKFYTTAENAQNTAKGGVANQKVARYVKGKVLYYAWVNPDNVNSREWYNSPAIRNNVYHIHITGFRNLGTNWNPLFPEDPDNPKGEPVDPTDPTGPKKPLNPDPKPSVPGYEEPENPIDPTDPLTTPETWMSVDVKVLPWKLHSYGVNLGI